MMDAAAGATAEAIVKRAVTTSGEEVTTLVRTLGTPASTASGTHLLRDPGGERKSTVPRTALAQITLAEITDVAVTGVEGKKLIKALKHPHFHSDQPCRYNFRYLSPKTTASRASYSTPLDPKRNCVQINHALVRGFVPPQSERERKS